MAVPITGAFVALIVEENRSGGRFGNVRLHELFRGSKSSEVDYYTTNTSCLTDPSERVNTGNSLNGWVGADLGS